MNLKLKENIKNYYESGHGIIFLLSIILIFLFALASISIEDFLTMGYMNMFISSSVFAGLLALSQSLIILSGGIDMSCGAIMFVIVLFALFLTMKGWMFLISFLIILGIGALLGMFNGTIISKIRASPIIITIGSLSFFSGISYVIYFSGGMKAAEQTFPPILSTIATFKVGGITILFFWFVLVAVLVWLLLDRTGFGRKIRALGSNPTAAQVSGIRVGRVQFFLYTLSGVIAAFAGLLYIGWSGAPYVSGKFAAGAGLGLNLTLQSIIIPLIGGIRTTGGRGNIWGTFLSVWIFNLILSFVRMMGYGIELQRMLSGLLILVILILYSRAEAK